MSTVSTIKEELKQVKEGLSTLKGLFKQSMEMADRATLKSKCEGAVEGVKFYIGKLNKVIVSIDKDNSIYSVLQSLSDLSTEMTAEKKLREKCGNMFAPDSALYSVYMGAAFGIGEAEAKVKPIKDKVCNLLIEEAMAEEKAV